MRSRGTFRFWKRAPSFTIGLTFRFADYTKGTQGARHPQAKKQYYAEE